MTSNTPSISGRVPYESQVCGNEEFDCGLPLGANFLTGNKAVLDCHNNHLRIGADNFSTVPFLRPDVESKAGGSLWQ